MSCCLWKDIDMLLRINFFNLYNPSNQYLCCGQEVYLLKWPKFHPMNSYFYIAIACYLTAFINSILTIPISTLLLLLIQQSLLTNWFCNLAWSWGHYSWAEIDWWSISLSRSINGLNSEFSFSWIGGDTKGKELVCPTIYS